jgi:hypothetical protein
MRLLRIPEQRRSGLPILPVHGALLSGVRAAYEIMLADTKEDLMENSSGPINLYV